MVDDELSGDERVDLAGIAAECLHGLPHRGEVNDRGHAGQVLHDHPRRAELDLDARLGRRIPLREGRHVRRRHVHAVLGAEQVLQQDLQAERKIRGRCNGIKPVYLVAGLAYPQRGAAVKAIRAVLRAHRVVASCPILPELVLPRAASCILPQSGTNGMLAPGAVATRSGPVVRLRARHWLH